MKHSSTCPICLKPFEPTRKRICCSRSCAAKLACQTKGKLAWQPEEDALLEALGGVRPIRKIVAKLKRHNKKREWPVRSQRSVEVRMKRLGISRVCTVDNLTPSELARTLNVPRDRVEGWVESKGCPCRKVDGYKGAIRLSQFRVWATENPELLAGIDTKALQYVLEDEALVAHIGSLPVPTIGRPQPVRRLDTGEVFSSVRAAARKSYIHPKNIRSAIKRGGTSAGTQWEYVKEA